MDTEYVYPQDKPNGTAGLARAGGLTLRDKFAGDALKSAADAVCSLIEEDAADWAVEAEAARHATAAYIVADAMLKARAK